MQILLLARGDGPAGVGQPSASMAPRSTPMLPRARPSATNASWKSKPSCKPKSTNSSLWPSRPTAPCPKAWTCPRRSPDARTVCKRLAEAKAVLEARAAERYAVEQAEYEAKMGERADKAEQTGKKPRGKPPAPPTPGPRDKDQYNFTDPESRIMKNSRDDGFSQHYNGQVAVDEDSRLIVGCSLSNHANDQHEVVPTLATYPRRTGCDPGGGSGHGLLQ